MVPDRSPEKARSSTQPSPEGELGTIEGRGLGLACAAGGAAAGEPQAARKRAKLMPSRVAARLAAGRGMCRRMLPVTRATDLARAMHSIEQAFLIGVEGATELLLIRHGDVYEDAADELDPPLSASGRDQATRLAERLNRRRLDAVYLTPLRRAMPTATAVGRG